MDKKVDKLKLVEFLVGYANLRAPAVRKFETGG